MKKIILLISILSIVISGCAKPQIVRIFPADEVSKMDMNKVLEDKDLSNEEKIQIIQMKLNEDIERKKRAVEAEKDNKLSSIINKPVVPLRTPDTILRVLILPYEDDNGVLNGWKYSYVKVDDGKWIMADYLNGTKPSLRGTLTPLNSGEEKGGNIKGISMAPPITNKDIKTFSQYSEELKQEKEELEQQEKAAKKAEKQKKSEEREQQSKEVDREQAAVDNKGIVKNTDVAAEKEITDNVSANESVEIKKEPALNEIIVIDKDKSDEKKDTILSPENNKASIKDDTDKKELEPQQTEKKNINKSDKKDMKLQTQETAEDTVLVDSDKTDKNTISVDNNKAVNNKQEKVTVKDTEPDSALKTDNTVQPKNSADNNISTAEESVEEKNTADTTKPISNNMSDTVSDADTDNISIIPNRSIRNENRPNLFQIN